MIDFLCYSFLFAALLVFLGFGLSLLCCPRALRAYILPLSPVMGYCYVTLAGWYCYGFDIGGTDAYAVYLCLPPLMFLIFGIGKQRRQEFAWANAGGWAVPLCIGLLAFAALSIPLMDGAQGLTTISLGNNDIADSATKATVLKEFSLSDAPGFLGQQDTIRYHLKLSYFGPNLAAAFASSLLSLETYRIESLMTHVFFLLGVFVFYAVARESLRYNRLAALGLTALYGFNPLMWYIVYQGYLAQVVATTVSLGIFLVHFKVVEHCKSPGDYFPYFPFVVLLNWGLLISYPQVFPLVYGIVALYFVFSRIDDGSGENFSSRINFLIKTFFLSLILSPQRAAGILLSVFVVTTADFGWFFPLVSPADFLGIRNLVAPGGGIVLHAATGTYGAEFFLGLALFCVLIVCGFFQAYKSERRIFLLAGAAQLFIFSAYLFLAYRDGADAGLGGYRSFKLLTFFLPMVLLSGMIIFRQTRRRNIPLVLAGAALLACNLAAAYHLAGYTARHHLSVTPDLASLKQIENDPAVKSINLPGSMWWEILWQTNFLLRKQLYFATSTYQGRERSALRGEWDLLARRPEPVHLNGFKKPRVINVNSTYRLKEAWTPRRFGVQFGKGWAPRRDGHIRMESALAAVVLYSPDDRVAVDLRARFESTVPGRRVFIGLPGTHFRECAVALVCRAREILLGRGRNVIRFQAGEPPYGFAPEAPSSPGLALTALDISRAAPRAD
ncbi:MAG: hypothetical protein ACE5G9_05030 [Nitrospinales bacterium]